MPGTVVGVLEEDAIIDGASAERIHALSMDLQGIPWNLVMLESGQLTATGKWENVGEVATTCAYQPPSRTEMVRRARQEHGLLSSLRGWYGGNVSHVCTWQGSRGYLVTYAGAQLLLRYARPMMVQVDALMGLVATFEGEFGMYWPRVDIAHKDFMRRSTIWDGCLKCYIPSQGLWWWLGGVCLWMARWTYTEYKRSPRDLSTS